MSIRVLMLGWEFPPFISGGLGTACYGLTRAMENLDIDILMLLPASNCFIDGQTHNYFELEASGDQNPAHIKFKPVPSRLPNPYDSTFRPLRLCCTGALGGYDGNLVERVQEYAKLCTKLINSQNFDVIHAHDWVTFPAGIALAQKLSKPLVVHVHATEFDRSGHWVNPKVYEIERRSMEVASLVITVSKYTADTLMDHYGIPENKIRIVHNGIDKKTILRQGLRHSNGQKIVLFLGRITGQKGPKHFIEAAEKVLAIDKNVKFIMAGWGDQAPAMIEEAAAKMLGTKVLFTGFLRGRQVELAYQMADVYVMPSVSEPFGLTAAEAIQQGVPVILSNTTGVGEILHRGVVKVDYWDAGKMAESIIKILNNPDLAMQLSRDAKEEVDPFTWEAAARKCLSVYNQVMEPSSLSCLS